MQRPSTISQTGRRPGVLDHLSEGMSQLLAVPPLVLIPILLDLYLLLGPRISSAAITDRLGIWARRQDGDSAIQVADWLSKAGDWDLSRLMALLLPSVVDGLPQSAMFEPYSRAYVAPALIGVVLAGIGFALIGSGLFVGFLVTLARSGNMVRDEKQGIGRLIMDRWLKFLGFAALMAAVAILGSLVLVIPTVSLAAGGIGGSTIVGFLSLALLVVLVVTMFVPEAIVIDGAGPLAAIRSSAQVVFGSFWQAMGLFVVSIMFSPGLLSIWEEIAGDPVGLGMAIVVNAALITSLAIASLSFYRSRTDALAPVTRAA